MIRRPVLGALVAAAAIVGGVGFVGASSPVTPACVEAQAGDGWYSVARSIAPDWYATATQKQKDAFAGYLAAANGKNGTSAPLYVGQLVCYNPASVPTVVAPSSTTTTSSTSSTTATTLPPTTSSSTTTLPPTSSTLPPTSSTSSSTTAPSTTSTVPPSGGFPTRATAGLPAGWQPAQSFTGDRVITTNGAVVQDIRVTNGSILIRADNVTIRRVEVNNGRIYNYESTCRKGTVIEDSTVYAAGSDPGIDGGGYTVRNALVVSHEGFGVAGLGECGTTTIENSYAYANPPTPCGGDWHGDALQGFHGSNLVIRNSVFELDEQPPPCEGTSAIFWADGSGHLTIDGAIVIGGGYTFRTYYPSDISNLFIVDNAWVWGPVDADCSKIERWQNVNLATLDAAGQPSVVRSQPCAG